MADKIKINKCSYRSLLDLPGVGRKIADLILQQRDILGNITVESIRNISRLQVTEEFLNKIDFEEYTGDPEDDRSKERDLDQAPATLGAGMGMAPSTTVTSPSQEKNIEKVSAAIATASLAGPPFSYSNPMGAGAIPKMSTQMQPGIDPNLWRVSAPLLPSGTNYAAPQGVFNTVQPPPNLVNLQSSATTGYQQYPTMTSVKQEPWTVTSQTHYVNPQTVMGYGNMAPSNQFNPHAKMLYGGVNTSVPLALYDNSKPAYPQQSTFLSQSANPNLQPSITNQGQYQYNVPVGVERQNVGSEFRRPFNIPKSLLYDGTSNWQAFNAKFARYAEAQSWTAKTCKDYLCWCLEGKASEFYTLLIERDPNMEYFDIMRKLEKRFGFKDLPETAQIQFMQAKQTTEEKLEEWADRVLSLATRAFKNLPDEHMYQQAIMRLCQGATDKDAGQYAANLRPKTMEDALDRFRWYQHNNAAIFGRQSRRDIRYVAEEETEDNQSINIKATGPVNQSPNVNNRLSSLEQKVTDLTSNMSSLMTDIRKLVDTQTYRRRSNSPSPARGECYYCGAKGHFKRECPSRNPENKMANEEKRVSWMNANCLNGKGSDNHCTKH